MKAPWQLIEETSMATDKQHTSTRFISSSHQNHLSRESVQHSGRQIDKHKHNQKKLQELLINNYKQVVDVMIIKQALASLEI